MQLSLVVVSNLNSWRRIFQTSGPLGGFYKSNVLHCLSDVGINNNQFPGRGKFDWLYKQVFTNYCVYIALEEKGSSH